MPRRTKAQLEQLLLDEREARNADIRNMNEQLREVAAARDRYRAQVDSTGVAIAINEARARQLEAEDRARVAETRERAAQEMAELKAREVTDLEHRLEVAALREEVGALRLDNATLRHDDERRRMNAERDHKDQVIRELRDRASNPDLALTLENGQVLSIEHQTYNGRWQLSGYHLIGNDGAINLRLTRVPA